MRNDKIAAKQAGVSKAMRQYAKRYGSGVESMIATQKQCGDGWKRGCWIAKKLRVDWREKRCRRN